MRSPPARTFPDLEAGSDHALCQLNHDQPIAAKASPNSRLAPRLPHPLTKEGRCFHRPSFLSRSTAISARASCSGRSWRPAGTCRYNCPGDRASRCRASPSAADARPPDYDRARSATGDATHDSAGRPAPTVQAACRAAAH